jgi:hypothetical protein
LIDRLFSESREQGEDGEEVERLVITEIAWTPSERRGMPAAPPSPPTVPAPDEDQLELTFVRFHLDEETVPASMMSDDAGSSGSSSSSSAVSLAGGGWLPTAAGSSYAVFAAGLVSLPLINGNVALHRFDPTPFLRSDLLIDHSGVYIYTLRVNTRAAVDGLLELVETELAGMWDPTKAQFDQQSAAAKTMFRLSQLIRNIRVHEGGSAYAGPFFLTYVGTTIRSFAIRYAGTRTRRPRSTSWPATVWQV